MTLKNRLNEDMKAALRAGDKARLGVVRMALAAVKQVEVDTRTELDDSGVLKALEKMVKQRRDSISQFQSAGRDDLVKKEQAELKVLEEYLPEQLSAEEVDALIGEVIAATGASSPRDMGKVMGAIKSKAAGRVDMGAVSARVRERLQGI